MVAAMQGAPTKQRAAFSSRIATARDCIGYGFARVAASNGPYGDRAGQSAAQQFLAGGDAASLRRALEDRCGKPTYLALS